jgi:class 3 adenylate cyclase
MCALSCRLHTRQVKSMGDGVMIWAHDPADAVAVAERTLHEIGTRPDLLPVRIGVHTGQAVRRGGDWYGGAVNVAARLAAQARPSEALISANTRAAIDRATARGLRDCRELSLRGVARPVGVWSLA